MTKFELNKAIMKIVKDWKGATITNLDNPDAIGYTEKLFIDGASVGCTTYFADYCNNWNDLMPLVDKYNITAIYLEREEWSCNSSTFDDNGNTTVSNYAVNDDLQRALAECLLKVLEKNGRRTTKGARR